MLISLEELSLKHHLKPKGIIHLGAHFAEESESYIKARIKKVLWVEGNPDLINNLNQTVGKIEGNKIVHLVVSDRDNQEVEFNIGADDLTSSILQVADIQKFHGEDVDVVKKIKMKTTRLDSYFKNGNSNIEDYDFLNIDLQGAEMLAMQGMGALLDNITAVFTEVNLGNLYNNCPLLYNLDKFLGEKGLIRVELALTPWQWGDALYVRKDFSKSRLYYKLIEARILQWGSFVQSRINLGLKWCKRFAKKVIFKVELILGLR